MHCRLKFGPVTASFVIRSGELTLLVTSGEGIALRGTPRLTAQLKRERN